MEREFNYFRIWRGDGSWQGIHDTLRAHERCRSGRHTHPAAGCLDRLAFQMGGTRTWYGADALGSVHQTLNAGGTVLSSIKML